MNAYRGDVFAAAYVIGNDEVEELAPPLFGSPDVVFAQIRDAVGNRAMVAGGEGVTPHAAVIETLLNLQLDEAQLSLEFSTPAAIVAEVQHAIRSTGPSDLDSLEPQYLRPSDAKLPAQPR